MVARARKGPLSTNRSIPSPNHRIRFGGGLNTLAMPTDVADEECVEGVNFSLEPGNKSFIPRYGIKKVFQAPNNAAIVGYAALETIAGVRSMLLQAGATVYSWNGSDPINATNVGVVNASARLRGNANWALSADKCIITDLALIEPVKEWNGTTLTNTTFTKDGGSNYGTFKAKYCVINDERALYMNVVDAGANALPHVIVGSKRGDYKEISTANRASSSIGAADPWYLVTLDLKPICSAVVAFGQVVIPTLYGNIFKLVGSSPADFAVDLLFAGPKLNGYEAVAVTGNDIVYGAEGVIEALSGVQAYGDVEKDDLSLWIKPSVMKYKNWRLVFDRSRQRLYCFPEGGAECWVFAASLYGNQISPWMLWRSDVAHGMQPQLVFNAKNVSTGLTQTYLSDANGGLYMMEAETVSDQDASGNSVEIIVTRTSKTWSLEVDKTGYYFDGQLEYIPIDQNDITISTILSGSFSTSHSAEMQLRSNSDGVYFNGSSYFGGEFYFSGSVPTRFVRQGFEASGQSDMLACRISAATTTRFAINAVNYRFEATD